MATQMKIDKVDSNIIRLLGKNGRTTINEIASKLSISEGTVRNRIKKLTESGYLAVKGLVNPDLASEKQYIYILITLKDNDYWLDVAQKVSELKDVKSVSMLTGRFHMVVEVFIDPNKLIDFLTQKLPAIGESVFTESLVTVKTFNKWV